MSKADTQFLVLIALIYVKQFTYNRIAFTAAVLATPNGSVSGTVDAILVVGAERRELLNQLRAELVSGNDQRALQLARHYCGLVDSHGEEESRRDLQG